MTSRTPDVADWSDMADERVLRSQLRRRVFRAILALPAIYRAPVMLRDIQGMSTEEASAMLRVKDQTLKSRLHRGRLILRKQLADFAGGLTLHRPAYGTVTIRRGLAGQRDGREARLADLRDQRCLDRILLRPASRCRARPARRRSTTASPPPRCPPAEPHGQRAVRSAVAGRAGPARRSSSRYGASGRSIASTVDVAAAASAYGPGGHSARMRAASAAPVGLVEQPRQRESRQSSRPPTE